MAMQSINKKCHPTGFVVLVNVCRPNWLATGTPRNANVKQTDDQICPLLLAWSQKIGDSNKNKDVLLMTLKFIDFWFLVRMNYIDKVYYSVQIVAQKSIWNPHIFCEFKLF